MMDRASPSKKSNNSTGCQAETLTKDSTEAQQDQDFWGPECCEPTESVELVQEKSGVWWDEANKVNVVHCNLDDVSTADEESSDEEEDDASSGAGRVQGTPVRARRPGEVRGGRGGEPEDHAAS